jgi:hypothetical protein
LRTHLVVHIQDVPAPAYIRAKRFLDDLESGIRVLRRPDASRYVRAMSQPEATNVRELVQFMADHDLRFASAVSGDEAVYLKFYQALAAYDVIANKAARSNNSIAMEAQ